MTATYTTQILKDSNKKTIIKLTGVGLTTDESNTAKIVANTLFRPLDANNNLLVSGNTAKPYYGFSIYRVWYDASFNAGAYAQLVWVGAGSNVPIITMSNGYGEYNQAGNWVAIPNNSGANSRGDVGLITTGVTSGGYSIIIELHKDNNYYDAGQLTEPGAFNFNPFGITP